MPGLHKFSKNLGVNSKFYDSGMTLRMFHTEIALVLHTTVQNLVATMTWHPGFMHPSLNY